MVKSRVLGAVPTPPGRGEGGNGIDPAPPIGEAADSKFTPLEQKEILEFGKRYNWDLRNDWEARKAVRDMDKAGETLLHKAAQAGKIAVVKFLVSKKADINRMDNVGATSLHKAAFNGHIEVITYLVAAGADVNAKDKDNETPLHKATRSNKIESVKLLVSKGADVHAKDKRDKTPLDIANDKENTATIEFLSGVQ